MELDLRCSVSSAKVMMDRETGRSKGFGFVEMAFAEMAQVAITGLNGMSVDPETRLSAHQKSNFADSSTVRCGARST
jgi:RNA recognition motif-containing protein